MELTSDERNWPTRRESSQHTVDVIGSLGGGAHGQELPAVIDGTTHVNAHLARLDEQGRLSAILRNQRTQGNNVVQRLLCTTHCADVTVQRQTPTADELDAGDQDASIDPETLHAQNYGTTPNPQDPYEKPPTNWDTLAVAAYGPADPPDWVQGTRVELAPLPNLKADGTPAANIEQAKQKVADESLRVFENDLNSAASSWISMTGAIHTYLDASNDLEGNGVLGTRGLGWNAGPTDADMGTLTAQQMLGPNNSIPLESLFANKNNGPGTSSTVDSTGLHKTKKTQEATIDINNKKNTLTGSLVGLAASQQDVWSWGGKVIVALQRVEIAKDKLDQNNLQAAEEKLSQEKEAAIHDIEQDYKGLESGIEIALGLTAAVSGEESGLESTVMGTLGVMELISKAEVAVDFDPKIEELDGKLKNLTNRIVSEEAYTSKEDLVNNQGLFATSWVHVFQAEMTVRDDMRDLQNTYRTLAEEAGEEAGGGEKGARVQAAIEAIPRIDVCLARIDPILVAINLPKYTESSGRGFNGCDQPQDFIQHLSWMKGYQSQYQQIASLWKSRRESLNNILKKLGPA